MRRAFRGARRIEHPAARAAAADVDAFLLQPGAQLLTDPQRRNLARTAATNRRRAA